jgi:hypothetical protein
MLVSKNSLTFIDLFAVEFEIRRVSLFETERFDYEKCRRGQFGFVNRRYTVRKRCR